MHSSKALAEYRTCARGPERSLSYWRICRCKRNVIRLEPGLQRSNGSTRARTMIVHIDGKVNRRGSP